MTTPLRVLMIAGEASGDLHGAALLRALRERVSDVEVSGVGGSHLRAAGMRVLVDTASVSTMGFTETFGTLGRLLSLYRRLVRFLDEHRPDLVVLIDYPEFNLLLARQAKRRRIPVFYFIGPQVWAWRAGRVRKIRRRVDKMGVVFPFEPALYNHETELAEFIGHPLLDLVRPTRSRADTLQRYDLDPNLRTVVLLPGSRKKEIRSLLEPMCAAAAMLRGEGWQAVLALAPDLDERDLAEASNGCALPFTVAKDDTYNVVAAADAAIVASGTATLETALLGCPMVIVYRVSPVTYWLARRLVRVDSIGMPNIVLQRPVFPELIQADATAGAMVDAVRGLMSRRADLVEALATLRLRLGTPGAAGRAADLALQLVQ